MQSVQTIHLTPEHNGLTLAQVLKRSLSDKSWNEIKRQIAGRRVQVNGNLCRDEGRRVKTGDVLRILPQPLAAPATAADVKIVHVDEHLLVVQKPAGVTTLRHREETDLPQRRKQLQPTLDELVPQALARHLGLPPPEKPKSKKDRRQPQHADRRFMVRAVHRLDRDTSGLMLFARTPTAEQKLVRMFAQHAVERSYVAVAIGRVEEQTVDTWLVRDRGDGLRGSSPAGEAAEGARRAITHLRPLEHLPDYTILECRLETGRTHQIRIHLAEIGHPLCGEKVYTHRLGGKPISDASAAPRQALHAAEIAFLHPLSGQPMRFRMALPADLKSWLLRLRKAASGKA